MIGGMGNSGKLAIGAALAAVGLMVLTVFTLNEMVLAALVAAVVVAYAASIWCVFARGRYFAVVLGAVGSSLALAFSIAFLRMWGLAFNKDASALGQAVTSRDSDIYFYLAVITGLLTLALLFVSAVWPSRRVRMPQKPKRPAPRKPAAKKPAARRPAAKTAVPRKPAAKSPVPRKPGTRKPASSPTR